jgi:hypothetical protein
MFKRCLVIVALATAIGLTVVRPLPAGIRFVNNCQDTIKIGLITTFGDHVYEDCWIVLKPGEERQVGVPDFWKEFTFWVVVKGGGEDWVRRLAPPRIADIPIASFNIADAHVRAMNHSGQIMTNRFVADNMRRGNWAPFLENYGGGDRCRALRIDARQTGVNATLTILDNRQWRFFVRQLIGDKGRYQDYRAESGG